MLKYLSRFSLVLLIVWPYTLWAEEVRVSCSEIADATERLACFDRTFPGDSRSVVPQPKVDSIRTIPVVPQGSVEAEATSANTRVEQTTAPSKGGMFSKKAQVNISSRLKSVRDQDKQKMIFLLENDQIWIQDSPRSLPFAKGQEVTVKSGTVGGYSLSNEEGLATRVRRIK